MIGDADTLAPRPTLTRVAGRYAKGALLQMQVNIKSTGLGYITELFNNLNDWVMVYGQLRITNSRVDGPAFGYAAGYHRTQLLTDNCRAKVMIQSGTIGLGESRVFICSDNRMNNYYGMAINKGALVSRVSIIRGSSSISVDEYESTTVALDGGDEFEVWYDRMNSTVRIYENGAEIAAKYFPPTDIPHGPGARYTGVVMSARRVLDNGPQFSNFTATDVMYVPAEIRDPIDSLTVNPSWSPVTGQIEVHRHIVSPMTLGPKKTLSTVSAAVWSTPMSTDSVRAVFTTKRMGDGRFRVAVRSNASLTNWVGVEFNGTTGKIRICKGSAPNTVTYYADEREWIASHEQFTITWNEANQTLKVYQGAKRTPTVSYTFSSFTGTGRYFGLVWDAALVSAGVEPSSIDVYAVTADSPLPIV